MPAETHKRCLAKSIRSDSQAAGRHLPPFDPRRRVEQALYAVIIEAYIQGVSTRKADSLESAIVSQSGVLRSQVSRISQVIYAQEQAFLIRPRRAAAMPSSTRNAASVTSSFW
jgi:hypothetical protein